ncbi:uncharacterized protein [Dermacentor andersoni]|uniref:uncharacterized protein n=1 Tax=Dermacentor andersoni TaxID=34620 RepID=UPI003B3B5D8B
MCSEGAVSAAHLGRGNRNVDEDSQDYQVMLPQLPKGRIVFNTVFLHGDIRARPYRVEDYRDALASLKVLPEVVALGAFQTNHVWAVTMKSSEAVNKLLTAATITVKGRRCLVVDPNNQDLRLKMHWVLHNVSDEDVREALAPYGEVTEVSRERWRAQGVTDKGSTTRLVNLKLKPGVKSDDIPHQLRVAGEPALLVVPGRPPLCLRCQGKGHVRRECRVPRCSRCKRFGHDESQCAPTYANVTGPIRSTDSSELVMDEAEAEETAAVENAKLEPQPTPPATVPAPLQRAVTSMPSKQQPLQERQPDLSKDALHRSKKAKEDSATSTDPNAPSAMETDVTSTSNKRAHIETVKDDDPGGGLNAEEPPAKAAPVRRSPSGPKPSVPPDKRKADAAPK